LFSLFSLALHKDWLALGAALLGSLLPDIDTPKSSLGRLLPFLSIPIERRWGHRTLTHSLLLVAGLGLVCLPLYFLHGSLYGALLIGIISHLMADCATLSGVPLFYPHPSVCVLPGNPRYRIRTGSLGERGLLVILLLLLALTVAVSSLGGTWRAIRYLMATQKMAYSDYREATMETQLNFKGRWRFSRQPVEGTAVILDGNASRFLIAFEGQTLVYGEQGDILPDRSRVKTTDRPIRLDTLAVYSEKIQAVVKQLPAGAYVSGTLRSNRFFQLLTPDVKPTEHVWFEWGSDWLKFMYAPVERLGQIQLIPQVDIQEVQRTQEAIETLTQQIQALQLRRPPVHYEEIRRVERLLAEKERSLVQLQDPWLQFSGTLNLRLMGVAP